MIEWDDIWDAWKVVIRIIWMSLDESDLVNLTNLTSLFFPQVDRHLDVVQRAVERAARRHRQTGFPTASEKCSELKMKVFSNGYPLGFWAFGDDISSRKTWKNTVWTSILRSIGLASLLLKMTVQLLKAEEHSCGRCTDPCHSWWGGSWTQNP